MSATARRLTLVHGAPPAAMAARPAATVRRRRTALVDAALCLSLAAGLAHLVGTPEHLDTWPISGVFFGVLGLVQSGYAWLLFRGRRGTALLTAGVAGTAAVIVLYVVSRTAGLPFAPPVAAHGARFSPGRSIVPGALPPVGAFDLLTLAAELGLVVCLVALLPARPRARAVGGLMWTGAALWGLALLGVLG